jgi:hypothetical protein
MQKFIYDLLLNAGGFMPGFLATGLPAGFLVANAIIKRAMFKQTDFHFFGGDMVFCGSVLFVSNLLRELSVGHLRDGLKIAVYVLISLALFFLWLIVLWIGSKRQRGLSVFAALLSMVIFSFCGLVTWSMLQSVKNGL